MPESSKGSLKVVLTSEGGSGHKAAAAVLEEKFTKQGDDVHVINMTNERWYSGFLGIEAIVVDIWNFAQKHGCTFILKSLSFLEIFHNIMTFVIKNNVISYIEKHIDDYDEIEIHNTFPVSLAAIVDAVAEYNRANNKSVKVKYVHHLTDLPSDYAKNLKLEFSYINPDNLADAQFQLVTVPPVMREDDNIRDLDDAEKNEKYLDRIKELFPNIVADINKEDYESRIKLTEGPVRKEFFDYSKEPASRSDDLGVSFDSKEEYDALKKLLDNNRLFSEFDEHSKTANISLNTQDKNAEVISIMLGSQADIDGSLSLVSSEFELFNKSDKPKPKYVFLFCGPNNESDTNCLYQQAMKLAYKYNNENFKVIPLTKQGPKTIAQLYSTADLLCIRPGGLSSMEARLVARGKVMVYTVVDYLVKLTNTFLFKGEEDLKNYYSEQDQKERLSELVVWEEGNAKFLQQNLINEELEASNVSCANQYSYFNMRHSSNVITNTLTPLIIEGKFKSAIDTIRTKPNLNTALPQFGGKIKKMALVASIINNLSNIKNKYAEIKPHEILNESCKNRIQDLIDSIGEKIDLLENNPLSDGNAKIVTNCYQDILDTSTHVYDSIKYDISEKNQDIINEIASIILSIIAQIPVINYLVKDSLEGKFYSMKSELSEVDTHVKRLMKQN